ncbi:hypothetical protein ACJMK2_020565, partial [Sinanodonta woodiana]
IIYWMAYPVNNQIFRPSITDTEFDSREQKTAVCDLIQSCWQEDPCERPNIKTVIKALNAVNPF